MFHRGIIAVAALGIAPAAIAAGPDVLGGDLSSAQRHASVGSVTPYSFAMSTCNVGDARIQVNPSTPLHPITTQNVYRLANGRFEQIGMGWVFHHFCTLQENLCATCSPAPACNELGVGCSSSDTAGILGSQAALGPRSQVNASTGVFPFPFTAPAVTNSLSRRVQVADADLSPALNPGATYFAETVYVARDDDMAGNATNNASHRRYTVSGAGPYNLTGAGTASRGSPALLEWASADPGVVLNTVDVPGDGRFYVASKATQIACNRYSYEYAVYNLNSDRSAGSFTVPFAAPGTAANIGFHDIGYHSGETFSGADWPATPGSCELSWATDDFAVDPNANAIRWGTLYNFRFETHWAPTSANAAIGLFKTGAPGFVTVGIVAPSLEPAFTGDYDGDGAVGLSDAAFIINNWFNPCGSAGLGGMGQIINHWAETCP